MQPDHDDREMSLTPRKPSLSNWELWACAKQQIDQHGTAAPDMAARRADRLLASGDTAGQETWLEIMARIRQLLSALPGETRH
jgi:hypothetical protein